MVYKSARVPAIILLDRSSTREFRAKSVFFKIKTRNRTLHADSIENLFQDRAFNLRRIFLHRNECG